MCFEIDKSAPKPKQKHAYKVFAVIDGDLVSQYPERRRGYTWHLGLKRDIRDELARYLRVPLVADEDNLSSEGLYALLRPDAGAKELVYAGDRWTDACVLAKCAVDPRDHIHSSARKYGGYPGRHVTYYALTPMEIVEVSYNRCSANERKAVRRLVAASKKFNKKVTK